MMPNARPATGHSRNTLWSKLGRIVRAKSVIALCLLSSAALLSEPQVAQARNGVNGFVAGAILGGALSGLAGGRARVYRGGTRTYRRAVTVRHYRGGTRHRDRGREETASQDNAPLEKAAKNGTVIDTRADAGGSGSAGASSGSTTAISSSAAASDGGGAGARSSRHGGRRGSGGLQTLKDGLD